MVIADTSNIPLLSEFAPFLFLSILSKKLSDNNTNSPPAINPSVGKIHIMYPSSADNSMEGAINDQKAAAIITPALNPKTVSKTFLFISLKKKTTSAPSKVTPQVNVAAIKL